MPNQLERSQPNDQAQEIQESFEGKLDIDLGIVSRKELSEIFGLPSVEEQKILLASFKGQDGKDVQIVDLMTKAIIADGNIYC